MSAPAALLLLSSDCPHCPAVLEALGSLLKAGGIGRLEAVNLAVQPEIAQQLGVRSVPWTRIGPFELEGALAPAELRRWAELAGKPQGIQEYFFHMLKAGRRDQVERAIRAEPHRSAALAELMRDPATSMAVRLGIGAVLEEFHGSGLTDALVPALGELTGSSDALIRADACHFLSLIGGPAVMPYLRNCLDDADLEVREIARDALAELDRE